MATSKTKQAALQAQYGVERIAAGEEYVRTLGVALRYSIRATRNKTTLESYREERRKAWDRLVALFDGNNQAATKFLDDLTASKQNQATTKKTQESMKR